MGHCAKPPQNGRSQYCCMKEEKCFGSMRWQSDSACGGLFESCIHSVYWEKHRSTVLPTVLCGHAQVTGSEPPLEAFSAPRVRLGAKRLSLMTRGFHCRSLRTNGSSRNRGRRRHIDRSHKSTRCQSGRWIIPHRTGFRFGYRQRSGGEISRGTRTGHGSRRTANTLTPRVSTWPLSRDGQRQDRRSARNFACL